MKMQIHENNSPEKNQSQMPTYDEKIANWIALYWSISTQLKINFTKPDNSAYSYRDKGAKS